MENKQDVIAWLEANRTDFTTMSDAIWARPETAHREFFASKTQADYLAAHGFKITPEAGGLKTAFVAEWGAGSPILGFAGEYDALDGLSQKFQPAPEPITPGAPGHGCGHNLLGTGCLAAAMATKEWLQANGKPGTIRYFGCPAEENTYGKTFMARAGVFDGLDAALNYHPSAANFPSKGSAVGVFDIRYRFTGKSSHAGATPHLGRSALDAVTLMNIGVNYLREHVTEKVRMHYVITNGGDLPNIVPAVAEVWYFLRAPQITELEDVARRVRLIAQGAALMTETRLEETFRAACSNLLNNAYLADLQYENMKLVGPMVFTEEEKNFAQRVNQHYPSENIDDFFNYYKIPSEFRQEPLLSENFSSLDVGKIETGSTDVGDLSWITPLSLLNTTCFPTATSGHCWGIVASSASTFAHKGMLHAAKIMALTAIDLFSDPAHLQKARQEFEKATHAKPYHCPLPNSVQPPQYQP